MNGMLSPTFEKIRNELDAASSRAREITAQLPRELIGRRPGPTSWSVAECLAHLTLTTDAYVPLIREALTEARSQNLLNSGRRFRTEFLAWLLARWLEPPYRLKLRAPAPFVPAPDDPMQALPEFLNRQQELLQLLPVADGLAIDRLRIPSPFAPRMRFSIYSVFRLIPAHQRRHLWQAEKAAAAVTAKHI